MGWWLQTEDLPDPNNRVRIEADKIHLDYTLNNTEAWVCQLVCVKGQN
jgi:hypothetical protein